MALSGVRDQATTVGALVNDALSLIGGKVGQDTASAEDLATGIIALRLMLRTWAVKGVRLWLTEIQSVPLVDGTATYTLDPRTLEVSQAVRRQDDNDVPVRVISREEYQRLPNKTTSGAPYAVFVDRQRTSTTATAYPVPGAAEDAANMTLRLTTKRQIQDPTASSEEIEIPAEWMEAVTYNLGIRMAPRLNLPIDPVIAAQALDFEATLTGQDREESVRMRPRARPRR